MGFFAFLSSPQEAGWAAKPTVFEFTAALVLLPGIALLRRQRRVNLWPILPYLCVTDSQIIQAANLPGEITLTTVAWVSNLHNFGGPCQAECCLGSIISNGHKATWSQHCNQFCKQRSANDSLVWLV